MAISMNWVKEYIDLKDVDLKELATKITNAGVNVEHVISNELNNLVIGEVLECEKLKKSKKLLVSQIRVGNEVRQIVSGIANYYTPEQMVGKKVAVITNLKPAKLCGVESQGMILAAGDDEGNLSVLTVDKDIISGSEIS